MRRSKSNSLGNTPLRPPSSFLSNYDTSVPVWTFRRMDSSPPPPYTSQEGSPSGSILPTAPVDASYNNSQRNDKAESKAPTSSEYTPLLEDFTRKFVESQLSIPNSQQQVHNSTSQLVPPELLLLCQQQAPFNPNFDSLSTSSTTSLLTLSESMSRHNSISQAPPKVCGIFSKARCSHIRWFLSNFILLTTLMAFNWGMLVSPQIYSNFFLVFMQNANASAKDHQANSIVIDLSISAFIQFALMIIALMSGLILLFAATRVVATVRKRFHASMKYRIHISNQTPFPWFFITYERIVYETMGAFFARLLSLILTLYLFGVSAIYVLLLSDYLDMFLSLLNIDQISQIFCQNHPWYLSHEVLVALWLTLILLLIFGFNSFRRRSKYSSSLWYLKRCVAIVGFFSVIYLIFVIVLAYMSSNQSSQTNLLKAKRTYSSNYRKLACLKSDSSFDWGCLNKNWSLLFLSVPLLIAPFHLNELLITLLFASQQQQDQLFNKHTQTGRNVSNTQSGALGNRQNSRNSTQQNENNRFSDYYVSNGAPLQDLQQRLQFEQEAATPWEQLETRPILDDTINVTLPSTFNPHEPESIPSTSHLFSKPVLSFGSVRNLFVLVTFATCLLNIIINVFVYISTFNTINTTDGFHAVRDGTPSSAHPLARISPQPDDNILLLDLNFLNNYLHLLHPDSSSQEKKSCHRWLLIAASGFLLLKTTFVYLLLAFRGLLSHQTLTSTKKQNDLGNQAGICLNSFLFTSPFVLWNCLVLLFALFVEQSTALLQYLLLSVCWLGCLLVFIYPALILLYFSFQSMNKHSLTFTSSYTLLSVSFKPLRWPKASLLLGLFLLSLGLFYLVFWLYAYMQRNSHTLMSILPLITHTNATSLYCYASS